jgi:hypothetical protein
MSICISDKDLVVITLLLSLYCYHSIVIILLLSLYCYHSIVIIIVLYCKEY